MFACKSSCACQLIILNENDDDDDDDDGAYAWAAIINVKQNPMSYNKNDTRKKHCGYYITECL